MLRRESLTSKRVTTSSTDSDWMAVAIRILRRAASQLGERCVCRFCSQDQYIRKLESFRVCSSPAHSSGANLTAMAKTMKTKGRARTFDGSTAVCLLYKSS